MLEFQTQKLYSAYNYSASFQNSGATGRWTMRGLFQPSQHRRKTRQQESRTGDFLSVGSIDCGWGQFDSALEGSWAECGSGMQCNNAMSVENDSQSWVVVFFSFVLVFLTKCYRTMQQSSPWPSMVAPPPSIPMNIIDFVTLKLV